MTAERGGEGWYVYGVTEAGVDLAAPLEGARPIDRRSKPTVFREGPVGAIVSTVSLDDFDEARLPERLNDPDWLLERVAAHEDVLERALEATTVVPFRFGTVYRNEAAVRDFLADHARDLVSTLGRLKGRVELGVKGFVDREQLTEELRRIEPRADELAARIASAPEGSAYMLRRQLDRLLDDAVARFESECAKASHAALAAVAEAARLNPPQQRELSGHVGEMILNGAYLVSSDEAIRSTATDLQNRYGPRGVTFEVTGPWPPYNFVNRETT